MSTHRPTRIQVTLEFDRGTQRDEVTVFGHTRRNEKKMNTVLQYLLMIRNEPLILCDGCERVLNSMGGRSDFIAKINGGIKLFCEECA